ncbi:RNase adapter RapZ [Sphingomonas glaciei]|uniref:RNase adapter RapZ n=1 Tax=Sphingomonas glaciei TaxID=2938948 RepID=A0ABY5MYW0_9SPHN|nr:RNase adapter RapZ [Sphingomonas glaciei]UUR08981.1 RNase adapter RapZ [Sphingomonas glaciei]
MPRLLLVTGMSGAGKSSALNALEDMGWDTVDNLPTSLLHDFVHRSDRTAGSIHVAVGMDARSRGFDPHALPSLVDSVSGARAEILYLDATGAELARRYGETRRRHPLAPDRPAEDGIARERNLTAALRLAADAVLDTTDFKPADLRDELRRRYGEEGDELVLTLTSFGFARGISRTADLVFDLRFLPNPHWVEELRPLTGADAPVADFVSAQDGSEEFMGRTEELLAFLLPRYWEAGKAYVGVAFGCTGGRHRSVAAALAMGERLRARGFSPNIRHRDLALRPDDSLELGQSRIEGPEKR